MKELITISLIAIIYAIIRAKHDSYVNDGQWKLWAVIEAVFLCGAFTYLLGTNYIDYIFFPVIFAVIFSIVFDSACGLLRAKKFFYFGSGSYDQKMKNVFRTPKEFFIVKLVWAIVSIGGYLSF